MGGPATSTTIYNKRPCLQNAGHMCFIWHITSVHGLAFGVTTSFVEVCVLWSETVHPHPYLLPILLPRSQIASCLL